MVLRLRRQLTAEPDEYLEIRADMKIIPSVLEKKELEKGCRMLLHSDEGCTSGTYKGHLRD